MKAIDLFCGVGGMSLGAKRSGIKVVASYDKDWRHVETYNKNFIDANASILDIGNHKQLEESLSTYSDVNLIFGGPPCQGFSIGGKQNSGDQRNSLIFSFLKSVELVSPDVFVMENVQGILGRKFKIIIERFLTKSKKLGYTVFNPLLLNSKDFGVPQQRKRVFFIGIKKKYRVDEIQVNPVFKKDVLLSNVKDAIKELEVYNSIIDSTIDRHEILFEYESKYSHRINNISVDKNIRKRKSKKEIGGLLSTNHSKNVIERFRATLPGDREPISRYYRLKWNGVSSTLRAGTTRANGQFMASRPIHPSQPRCITVREAARLHSYPDWFDFYPTKWYGQMQIGNSVPPLLAQSVIKSVTSAIK